MDKLINSYIQSRPDLLTFLRYNPIWYRYLSRNPDDITRMESESKVFFGKTLTQRIERFGDHIQMASMLISMTETLKD